MTMFLYLASWVRNILRVAKRVDYNLEARSLKLSEVVIEFCLRVQRTPVTDPLAQQLVRSSTSIGANYCEADEAESKKDFRHKIALCRKESRETKYWLRLLAKACPTDLPTIRILWNETRELHLIFCAIIRTTDQNLNAR